MPSLVTVKILIDEEGKVFFPGEMVKGAVEVNLLKETSIKTVKLKTKGSAKVEWNRRNGEQSIRYVKTEKYYKHKMTLFGDGSNSLIFPKGIHKFGFSFELPLHVPCSFESKYGYVRHICKAVVDVNGKFFDVEHYALLSVGVLFDLNTDPLANKQILERKDKKGLFKTTVTPSLSLSLNIGHSGYVPGEKILINAECSNKSSRATKNTKLELFQTITCRASGNKNVEKKLICSKVHPATESKEDDIWSGTQLTVPPVPPSGLPGCGIIDVAYHLKFTFSPHFPSRDLCVSVPIIIGTVPLRDTFGTFVPGCSDTFRNHLQLLEPNFVNGACAGSADFVSGTLFVKQSTHLANSFPWTMEYPDLAPPSYKAFDKKEAEKNSQSDSDNDEASASQAHNKPTKYLKSKTKMKFSPFYVYYNQEISNGPERSHNSIKENVTRLESLSLTEKR